MLTLDDQHRFVLDGQVLRVRSVTRVLRKAGLLPDYGQIDPVVLARAAARGTAVHQACLEMNTGVVEPFTAEECVPYVRAYQQFVRDTRYVSVGNEVPLHYPEHGVAGVPDTWGYLYQTQPVVLDYKCTYSLHVPSVALQLAGYRSLIARHHPEWGYAQLFALHLRRTARYTLEPCDLPDVDMTWLAAVEEANGRGTSETAAIIDRWKDAHR